MLDSQLDALLAGHPVKASARLREHVQAELASGHSGDKADQFINEILGTQPVTTRPGLNFRIRARMAAEKRPAQPLWKWISAASGLAATVAFSVLAFQQKTPETPAFSPIAEIQSASESLNVDNVVTDPEVVKIMALASQMPDSAALKLDETGVDAIALYLE